MRKVLLLGGMLALAAAVLSGCGKNLYDKDELSQLHDVVGFVENQQTGLVNVIQDGITAITDNLDVDNDLRMYLSTLKIDPSKPIVAVTYDDGPSGAGSTEKILDILEENNAVATFFVVTDNITDSTAELEKRAVELGCEIGNHTTDHTYLTNVDIDTALEKVNDGVDKIYEYTGQKCTLLRPPGGLINEDMEENIDYPFILWSIDTRDWESRNAASVISIAEEYTYDGAIILMHDIYDSTAEASETLIPWLIDQGYQLVTIDQLAYLRGIDMVNGESYYDMMPETETETETVTETTASE